MIGVMERTGLLRTLLRRPSERRLLLGVGVFDGMKQVQLRSILAHEYGHYRNQDTAGGGFALAVRRSLKSLVIRLAKSGVASLFNPVWWFVRAVSAMYLAISQGASRLQEVLADRWAVRAYGSAAFAAGYRHIVERTVEMEHDLDATIREVVENRWPLSNVYDYDPQAKRSPEELAAAIEKELNKQPDVYDSHPASRQRIAWAERLAVARDPQPDDNAPVWDLFPDGEKLERDMTAIVREQIRVDHGVIIPERDEDEAAAAETA
jgi:Zn-dependent protease with chaperone function